MAIDIGCLSFRDFDDIAYVVDMDMQVSRNEHAICNVRAALKTNNIANFYDENRIVTIYNKENNKTIFCGYIMSLNYAGTMAEMQLISCSIDLDIEKMKRTFQNDSDKYENIINQIANEIEATVFLNSEYETEIKQAMYQYDETQWEFFIRLASMVQSSVYPCVNDTKPEVLLGIQDRTQDFNDIILEKSERKENEIIVVCYDNLDVGARVNYEGCVFDVISKKAYIEKSILLFEYRLTYPNTCATPMRKNKDLTGLVLFGKVADVDAKTIKVNFDIDESYQAEATHSYPWQTIMGNLLYCMPEKESRVAVCLNDEMGSKARGIAHIRTEEVDYYEWEKVFATPNGKKLLFSSDFLELESITALGESIRISFTEKDGITIKAGCKFNTEGVLGNITVKANVMELSALEQMIISKKLGNFSFGEISLNTTIEVSGQDVEMEGITRLTHLAFDDAPTEIGVDGFKWLKLLAKIVVTVAVVALACVAAVYLAPVIAGAAAAATGVAATFTTGQVVGGVVLACAVGGAVSGICAVNSQIADDKEAGITRRREEYMYMFCDKFCTGAISTAPMAIVASPMKFIPGSSIFKLKGFGIQMGGSVLASGIYQGTDWVLDEIFGSDFYDSDSSVVSTICIDVFANALGEVFSAIGSKMISGCGDLYKRFFKEELNIATRSAARQYLRETVGVDAMRTWRIFLEEIAEKNVKFNKKVTSGEFIINDLILAYLNSDITAGISSGTGEAYEEMEIQQYFEFKEGELVFCE